MRLLAVFLASLFLVGCSRFELAGTDEVVVRFSIGAEPPPARYSRVAIQDRLALYRIPAVVVVEKGDVAVTTRRRSAPIVRHALSIQNVWNVFPSDAAKPVPTLKGAGQRDWTSIIADASDTCMLLFELGPRGEWNPRCGDAKRAVRLAPVRGENGTFALPPLSPAGGDVVTVGSFVLTRDGGATDPAALAEVESLLARARVRPMNAWLDGRILPTLAFVRTESAPTNVPLASGVILIPTVFALAWLIVLRRFDRSQPEPWWLLLTTLGLGGVSAVGAAIVERTIATYVPALNPWRASGPGTTAILQSFVAYTITVGFVEEAAKFLASQPAYFRREFDEPVDGIVYASAAAAGFSLIENIAYLNQARLSPAVLAARTFLTLPAHVFISAIWGYTCGQRFVTRSRLAIAVGLVIAVLMHGAFDTLVTTPTLMPLAIVFDAILAVVFIVLVRRLLRYGLGSAPGAKAHRLMFPTGHFEGFAFSAFFFVGTSAALFVVCVFAEKYGFDSWMTPTAVALLLVFFASGFGVTTFVPLDIVVDHEGVTFSGVLRRWAEVKRVRLDEHGRRAHVVVNTSRGENIRLGVGDTSVMKRALETIEARLSSH